MEKKIYTADELNHVEKDELVRIILSLQENTARMMENQDLVMEQIAILRQQRFGRRSEKMDVIDGQMSLFFNEPEAAAGEPGTQAEEPEFEEVVIRRKKKKKGKREDDLKDMPVTVIQHEMSEDELNAAFPDGRYKRLPDEVYKRLEFHPASFEVKEHHVAVYAGMDNETIVKAGRPKDLLRGSIVTPSLEAAIINGKYVNSLPLYRMEQEFKRNDVNLCRQNMANWTIQCADRYLAVMYDHLHKLLYGYHVLQADETPVRVAKDGRAAGSKSFMWVYRTGKMYTDTPIILYEFQKTRNSEHPRKFLKDFEGVVVCDGYSAYHKLDKEQDNIRFAGCWAHARRKFSESLKALKNKAHARQTVSYMALEQIALIYKRDNELSKLTAEERAEKRNLVVRPLVESFFEWAKETLDTLEISPKSKTAEGLNYCVNQEKYLKVFLEDGEVPMDNNATEEALRGFCIGKHNWRVIDSIDGAKASAVIYSIGETAKANGLNPYEYYEYLLSEIPKHMEDKNLEFLDALLPWSPTLPERCHMKIENK